MTYAKALERIVCHQAIEIVLALLVAAKTTKTHIDDSAQQDGKQVNNNNNKRCEERQIRKKAKDVILDTRSIDSHPMNLCALLLSI